MIQIYPDIESLSRAATEIFVVQSQQAIKDNGLFTFLKNSKLGTMVFVVPPLPITKEQLDEGLAIVEKSLEITDAISKK